MHPWPSLSGITAFHMSAGRITAKKKAKQTSVEAASDGHHDNLNGKESRHASEDLTILAVDSVDTDDMDDRADRDENGRADRLKKEEMVALLMKGMARINLCLRSRYGYGLTDKENLVSKNATAVGRSERKFKKKNRRNMKSHTHQL